MSDPNSLIAHLIELRGRVLKAVLSVFVVFLCLVYFAQDLYHWLATPLLDTLPDQAEMIATDVASPFFAPFKLTLVLSFFIAIPVVLYQIWAFIAPGLYRNEKRLVAPLLFSSTLLFYSGMAFAYYVVFPLAFAFFTGVAPEGVTINTDISSYLDFVLKIFFAFGLSFEIPVAIVLMCWTGVSTPDSLRAKRPYVIVGVFTLGMLLTPPDIISQTLLAIPMWILFEVGILVGSMYVKRKEHADDDEYRDELTEVQKEEQEKKEQEQS
ncbi:sec-independent protein translocase protein TatC [Paraglaciecola mesophila KMM 241]|uniref:Sec-independent protein translocase protein TatC n=1 Tax=Paraglaciecola mesophila KMM 241 TaxID=1128912 RepID=K6YSE0_9ALTE|nr:twin-arginine translocase subunit TatC [Paraglaciecola mesophila]GAC26861.1 sec-independent protein translocase protein TatC [Paraglaciecola mesophila KMM 241]